jgi:hypothetical protein
MVPPSASAQYRAHWYIIQSLVESNPLVQRNGLVILMYSSSQFDVEGFDRKMIAMMFRHIQKILPIRLVGFQHVIQSRLVHLVMPFVYYFFGPELRARYRPYTRMTGEEIVERMEQFGVAARQLPPEFGGQYKFEYTTWLQDRQQIEIGTTG